MALDASRILPYDDGQFMKLSRPLILLALLGLALIFWPRHPAATAISPAPAPAEEVACDHCGPAPAVLTGGISPVEVPALTSLSRPLDRWAAVPTEPAFAEFKAWTERWLAASSADPVLLAEGVSLATTRRQQLADLIQGRAERALELTVPRTVAKRLPSEVQNLLEQPINTRGQLEVVAAMPLPGREDVLPSMARRVTIGDQRYHTFVYGEGTGFLTKSNVALNGIALPASAGTNPPNDALLKAENILALAASPARRLDAAEVTDAIAAQPQPPVCPTSGLDITVNHEPDGLEIAGEVKLYCGPRHVMAAAASLAGAENLSTPTAAAGGDPAGPVVPSFGVITNTYTQGYKRLLILRVDFPDFPGEVETITGAEATTLLGDLRTYLHQMSYGTHELAPVGPTGSYYTPVLRMSNNATYYDNSGLDRLYSEAKTKATAAGFDLSKFDWFGVFTHDHPAAGYAGLAYVGGVGFHMASGYFSKHVTSHEFGHNLGLPHAHRWDTTNGSVIGLGSLVEYGNPYDPIGATYDSVPGEKHYVGGYKKYLSWIPDADSPLITTSGLYRLSTTDEPHATGRRLLRLAKDSKNYWIEFRTGFTDVLLNKAVFLQWGNTDGRENSILDARPGTGGTAIVLGRTFSDPTANGNAGVHLTPVRLGGTFPESMDVFVQVGTAAGNLPPTVVIVPSTTAVAVQPAAAPFPSPITFTVTSSDPNNDALAYFWDFGDGNSSSDNLPTQTHTYSATGEYMAQVTVSDMKGGIASDSVLIRVEDPAVFRISGRMVFSATAPLTHAPLGGIRVTATNGTESHFVHTDSDGTYLIPGLAAKTWTLTAFDDVGERYSFGTPFFTNPVTVGPSFIGADFIASIGPSESLTALVAKLSTWKWFSTGAAPAPDWQAAAFDDSTWSSGPGVLGYGNETGQATTLPYGTDAANKWTSYYFRKTFTVADKTLFTGGIRLHTLRDDGVIVYLNGVEIFRDNMPTGAVVYSTLASTSTEPGAYLDQLLPLDNLLNGSNILSAEIHQGSAGSSDVAFDCALDGIAALGGAGSVLVALTSPEANQTFTTATASIPLTASAQVKSGSVTKVAFYADNVLLGEDTVAPYTWTWAGYSLGSHALKVTATFADATTQTSTNVVVNVTAPPTNILNGTDTWKYLSSPTAAPSNWATPSFTDTAWPTASGQIGAGDTETTGTAGTINIGPANARYPTIYFRKNFNFVDPESLTSLLASVVRDDGIVVYLNGVEIYRDNMPAGPIAYATLAAASGANTTENTRHYFTIDKSKLLPGNNILAAEVHQSGLTSSDLRFQFWLDATSTSAAARSLVLAGSANVTAPTGATYTTKVVAGGTLGITAVDFFVDGVKISTDTSYPFTFSTAAASIGPHSVNAVATDTSGGTITSNMLSLTVNPPYRPTTLVSFGDTWRYLDTGVDPGATWTAASFSDSAWFSGLSRLGYGGDGEVTVVNYGNEVGAKFITTWFRKAFTVADPAAFSSLLLRLVRDDGAVVYLNGTEIARSNLPAGTITPTTLALTTVNPPEETTPFEFSLPFGHLLAGTNVLAVEVHQAAASSSDLGMNCELVGQATGTPFFYLSNPSVNQTMSAAVDVPLSVYLAASQGVPSKVEYFASTAKLGESSVAPFTLTWTTPLLGSYALSAKATFPNGGTSTTAPVTIKIDPARTTTTFVSTGATWKYLDTGVAPLATWNAKGFDDSLWKSGAARLGFGADGELTAVASSFLGYYFRTTFNVAANSSTAAVRLRYQRDDGVAFYLDGVEIGRDNLPAGALTITSTAVTSIAAPDETAWHEMTLAPAVLALLTPGSHVLAAEVHQSSLTSSDLGLDVEMVGSGADASVIANTPPTSQPNLNFDALGVPAGQYRLSLPDATEGRLYLIQCSTDLASWIPYSYEFVRNGSVLVPITPAGAPKRFYRAQWVSALP